ncbi:unnamed protein product [Ceutorhynchus assimilis]|uniref:DUF4774 domain-containing protein n=1 Tax=Ceutorhynchus assimilis TaxID=467358 RepID=A0A9N9MWA2_9CUCU|nr:unnamed protein product [Ceutorhynchus assimilis]
MLLKSLCLLVFLAVLATAQKSQSNAKDEPAKQQVLIATPISLAQNQKAGSVPQELRQFYARQQYAPEVYGLTYAQPQYQNGAGISRLQPQIVLYGPGGQGQPILINPGNPPGNFLIPQGPGPNVIVRNNNPQAGFPVAGYPKPAHIPPIEKDAEEVPTNPSKIPPLQSDAKPSVQPKTKPEKLETFNEPNQPEQKPQEGQYPQLNTGNLRPGQRFFILNGDSMYNNYPFEAVQPNFKYTNVESYPQTAPSGFAQEPPQYLQDDRYQQQSITSLPDLVLRNSQPQNLPQQNTQQYANNQKDSEDKAGQQYFNPNSLFGQNQEYQPYFVDQQGQFLSQPGPYQNQFLSQQGPLFQNQQGQIQNQQGQLFQNQQGQLFQGQQGQIPSQQGQLFQSQQGQIQNQQGQFQSQQEPAAEQPNPKSSIVPPHLIGQFRFTPNSVPELYQFRDDLENDAIIVDASYDSPNSLDGRGGNFKAEESSTTLVPQPAEKEPESSMAQAAPQGTAIAGPGGVAGSAPRGTALVGKGGLAVSSPQATAVAGTKDEEKKNKRPSRKDA